MNTLILKNNTETITEAILETAIVLRGLLPTGAMSQQGVTLPLYGLIRYQFILNQNDFADGKAVNPHAINNMEAICNLIEHCRDDEKVIIEPFLSILKDRELVNEDNTVTETIRDIVLSAAENEGENMRLNFFKAMNILI